MIVDLFIACSSSVTTTWIRESVLNLRLITAPTTKSTHGQCRKLIAKGKPSASSTARYSAPMVAPSRQKSLVGI